MLYYDYIFNRWNISANCEGQAILRADVKPDANGVKRFKFTQFMFAINIGDYNIELDNLFNGDPTLGELIDLYNNGCVKPFITASGL